jgi:hypothetical protein
MKKTKTLLAFTLILMLCLTACKKPAPTSSVSEKLEIYDIAGTEWNARDDNSYLVLCEDGTYIWAKEEDVLDDNYFGGTYLFYRGEEALAFVTTELATYGFTESTMNEFIASHEEYSMNNFVCLTLLYETIILNGEELLGRPVAVPLYGMILENDTELYLLDPFNSDKYYIFIKQV